MGCFGTFIMTLIVLTLALVIVSFFAQGWSILIIAAAVITALICAYKELYDRLERIEQHLGLNNKEDDTPSHTEPTQEDEENAP